ncbi:amidase chyE [Apiospora kogelbergensis]|uniref:Amidase chyE n=1 Tax=Apiospora kogelbergensis TaxID=1337665 RepID=A0AAW0QPP4_9PEZI
MCGISVVVKLNRALSSNTVPVGVAQSDNAGSVAKLELEKRLYASLEQISHRGPDAQGVWIDPSNKVGLAHCRLSINDLTPDGSQPLHDDSGHVHAVINGEIYDHARLRAECIRDCGYQFRGHSDSEVAVALYRRYGAPEFLRHLRGEFSLVLYDDRTGDVIAAKDRFGIKPLFWTIAESGGIDGVDSVDGCDADNTNHPDKELWIAAEMKAFLPLGWKPEWDVEAIAMDTWSLGSNTTFKGVKRVDPGYYMVISPDGSIKHEQYWEFDYPDKKQVETRSVEEMIQQLREKTIEAVRLRLHADVPVGIYLSGGLDSSTVAGITKHLVQEQGESMGSQNPTDRIACFCVKFGTDSGFDESADPGRNEEIAQRTADHLGVQMHTIDMTEADFARDFEDTVWHNEQVTCDLNTVGKWALSKLPRDLGFKVILSGEGADEVFAGYHWFLSDFLLEADHSRPQDPLQQTPELRETLYRQARNHIRDKDRNLGTTTSRLDDQDHDDEGDKAKRQDGFIPYLVSFAMADTEMLHPALRPLCDERLRLRATTDSWSAAARTNIRERWHPLHSSLYAWNKKQLPAAILTVVGDRCEMAHSIEGRPPFLDHHLVELVNGMPPGLKERYQPQPSLDSNGASNGGAGSGSLQSGSSAWWRNNDDDYDENSHEPTASDDRNSVFSQFWEKWILREAARPFITDELYRRRKHPYTAPVTWPRDGPLQQMLRRVLTKENVDAVGFLDWPAVARSLEAGFRGGKGDESTKADTMSLRRCLLAAGYVVIAQRFRVAGAVVM